MKDRNSEIKKIRDKIDKYDEELIELLSKRMNLVLQARDLKTNIEDKKRESEILEKWLMRSNRYLSEKFLADILQKIVEYSKKIQRNF